MTALNDYGGHIATYPFDAPDTDDTPNCTIRRAVSDHPLKTTLRPQELQ
jgi:hypothetical protein